MPDTAGLQQHTALWLTFGVHHVAAILLAAGQSRRMGAFKPLLPFGDKTVIESCLDYLEQGGVETIVVVVGHRADEVREQLTGRSVIFALNPDPESEMGASIAAGVRALPEACEATLIALVDHPAVPPTVVSTLIENWRQGSRLIVPTWNGRGGHPVLLDLSFKPELLNLDASGGLRTLFDAHQPAVARIPVDSPIIARDMDTWDDYLTLHQQFTGKPASERRR
ncbi:MAG TPA: nucleotidyltransferase family protein [Pyrinomonadaceae bacterium]|nr:nucleotidyltransferase family protein [Pyrinomonadaceae bacterium]